MSVKQGLEMEARAGELGARRRGFAGGVALVLVLGLLACATGGGSPAGRAGDASRRPEKAGELTPEAGTEESGAPAEKPPADDEAAAPSSATAPAAPVAPAPSSVAAPSSATAPTTPSTAAGDSPVAGYLADPKAMTRGSQLFRAVCTGYCHSTQTAADRVAPNLFDCDWTHGSTDQEIFQVISAGVPDTQMQGFGERLPQDDLWKLVAYMRQKSACK